MSVRITSATSTRLRFSAPKGHPVKAQGNARGRAGKEVRALKGRHNPPRLGWAAPSGLDIGFTLTQGVALGYHRSGRWPESQVRWEGLGR